MKFFQKTVNYLKFFEDVKQSETDDEFYRIAIIFFGKENMIHIFDTKPYLNYQPLEEQIEDMNKVYSENNVVNIFNNINFQKDSNITKKEITEMSNNQEYIFFNNVNIDFSMNNDTNNLKRSVKYNIYKPRLNSRILSVISTVNDNIIGIKWFLPSHYTSHLMNGKISSKLLLSISYDGNVNIYCLKNADYQIQTKININLLQYNPFMSYSEKWRSISHLFAGKPIRDYHISSKPKKLYTLHIDNFIIVWTLTYFNDKLSFIANYSINLTNSIVINRLLIDSSDNFIYTFHNDCFSIYKIMEKPPFPLIFKENFNNEKKNVSELLNIYIKEDETDKEDSDNASELLDNSDNMQIHDLNFFQNIQKPEFTINEELLLTVYFDIEKKNYKLIKFQNKTFIDKIFSDFNFFNKCYNGNVDYLTEEIFISDSQINFGLSPYFYINNIDVSKDNIDTFINLTDIKQNYYIPIIIFEKETIGFYNLKNNKFISQYKISNPKVINKDASIKWLENNTVLLTSNRSLFLLIKFCSEFESLGICVNPHKVYDLFK